MKKISTKQGFFILVDDADWAYLRQFPWRARSNHGRTHYAVRDHYSVKDNLKEIVMHRQIMDAPEGVEVDHIDGNGLNNQRSNLRLCSSAENGWNGKKKRWRNKPAASKYKGVVIVSWKNKRGDVQVRYNAQIVYNYKHIYLGSFKIEEEAAEAYNTRAVELFGKFAKLNELE